jgi:glycosyltransferase involved in cell wall biosynthesis
MKVLHLPYNIASQISISVRALRSLGVEARGLARKVSPIQDDAGIETVAWIGRPKPVPRLVRGIKWRLKIVRAMAWADVLHWHWGDTTWKGMDLCIAAWLRKPRLVEFWGDDLRDPHVAARDNPFIARMYASYPELAIPRSKPAQAMFKRHGFKALIPGYELSDYLDPSIFPTYYHTRAGLMLDDYTPRFPDPHKQRPRLVHAPSNKSKKGTEVLEEVIRQLQRSYEFDFQLVHQMGRTDSLAAIAAGDLFLDQFTIGAEGLASHEAMALGKPVVCFIKDSLRKRYPASLPIVIADQHNLTSAIGALLKDGARRRELGLRGRHYIEEFHDARKVAAELVEIYQHVAAPASFDSGSNGAPGSRHWRSTEIDGFGQKHAERKV